MVFFCIAYLVLSHHENYWLAGLVAAPPPCIVDDSKLATGPMGLPALWKALAKMFVSLRFYHHEKCPSCNGPIL
jgi:hypothetical protein